MTITWEKSSWPRSSPDRSPPWREASAAAVAIVLPVGRWFDFVAPPPLFFAYLLGETAAYLALVELVKALFYSLTAEH
ncbi:MAG: hypothetical protein WDN01_00035 [Rhizomicrobium sp.]